MAGQSRKSPNARKAKERAEAIDNLLDIYPWNKRRYEATGDESFREKVSAVESLLKYYVT